ncbi:hypothetical protein IE53DRAFT_390814 [Violaceomyces palustris]|uniref:Uncharacterized protein n=1 Tax=Violaceomyces palustris TaxID=1673888 RepID=A0ACD0NMN0_9BASI|nr:hypothetical protein IE53DRAFT_390814 [Violaceomyces palustris]
MLFEEGKRGETESLDSLGSISILVGGWLNRRLRWWNEVLSYQRRRRDDESKAHPTTFHPPAVSSLLGKFLSSSPPFQAPSQPWSLCPISILMNLTLLNLPPPSTPSHSRFLPPLPPPPPSYSDALIP